MVQGYDSSNDPPGWFHVEGGPLQGGVEKNVPADPFGSSESPYYDSRLGPGAIMGGGYGGDYYPGPGGMNLVGRAYNNNGDEGKWTGFYDLSGNKIFNGPQGGRFVPQPRNPVGDNNSYRIQPYPAPELPYGAPSRPPLQGNVNLTELRPQISTVYNQAPEKYQPTAAPNVNLPPLPTNPGVNVPTFSTGGGPNISNTPIGGGAASNITAGAGGHGGGGAPYPVASGGGGGAMASSNQTPVSSGGPGDMPLAFPPPEGGAQPYGPMGGGAMGGMAPQPGIRAPLQGQVSMDAMGQPMANAQRPGGSTMQVPLNPQGGPVQQAQAAGTPLIASRGGGAGGSGLVPPPPPGMPGMPGARPPSPDISQAAWDQVRQQYPGAGSAPNPAQQEAIGTGAEIASAALAAKAMKEFEESQKETFRQGLGALTNAYEHLDQWLGDIFAPHLQEAQASLDKAKENTAAFERQHQAAFDESPAEAEARTLKNMEDVASGADSAAGAARGAVMAGRESRSGVARFLEKVSHPLTSEATHVARDTYRAMQLPQFQNYEKHRFEMNQAVNAERRAIAKAFDDQEAAARKSLIEMRKSQVTAYSHAMDKFMGGISRWMTAKTNVATAKWTEQEKMQMTLKIAEMQNDTKTYIEEQKGAREQKKEARLETQGKAEEKHKAETAKEKERHNKRMEKIMMGKEDLTEKDLKELEDEDEQEDKKHAEENKDSVASGEE